MLKYFFDECLIENQKDTINVSVKFRSASHATKHSHDFYELILVSKNELAHCLNGAETTMYKCDLCLITPDDLHYSWTKDEKNAPCYYTISMRAEYFKMLTTAIGKDFSESIISSRYTSVKAQVFEQCRQQLDQALLINNSEMRKKQSIYQLVAAKLLCEFSFNAPTSSIGRSLVEKTYALMSEKENMALSVKDIAAKLGYSQEHLIRTFKKSGELPPNTVFTIIKLDYAKELLVSTDYPISQICELIGYNGLHYFYQIFKKYCGCSPNTYRKNNSIPF